MTGIPYVSSRDLAPLAARTKLIRIVLAALLVALVLIAAVVARSPHSSAQPLVAPSSGAVVVLDLSASVTSDTYSRIHESLQELIARGGRYGLVVFSSVAYEALPPGTPASALQPIVRYFTASGNTPAGEQPSFPVNPWTNSFTSGTEISAALDLARSIEVGSRTARRAVVLISDLADDPNDFERLDTVLNEYRAEGIQLRVIALNADPNDIQRFRGLIGKASSIVPAGLAGSNPAALKPPHTSFPTWVVVVAIVVAVLLGVNELRSARLRWGGRAAAS